MKQKLLSTSLVVAILVASTSIAGSCKKDDPITDSPISVTEDTPVTDYDGNTYKTVKIENQVWMAENLRVTHFRNGDPIPNVTGNSQWAGLSTGAYCAYNNDYNADFVNIYGCLYNWYAVNDNRVIAPVGWHIPTIEEWRVLVEYLGEETVAGGKLKETGTTHWKSPNTGASNLSLFTAIPSGNRDGNGGIFRNLNSDAYISLLSSDSKTWFGYLNFESSKVITSSDIYKQDGFAVRCVKD